MRANSLFAPPFFRLLIPFGLGYFLSVLLGSANAIMSPILVDTFRLSPYDLGAMSSVYLFAFGVMQFPLGVFLDRFGARRTLAPLLLFAAAGSAVFGLAQSLSHLVIARALAGIGLAGCLMAAFKAFADWVSKEKLPVAYSIQCLTGGIGGMVATRPVALAVEMIGWRTFFVLLAVFTVGISFLIWFMVPEKEHIKTQRERTSLFSQLKKMFSFFLDGDFWYIAPIVTAAQGVMFCYLYLWVGPWMRDVARLPDAAAGVFMMYAFTGAAAGYFLNGILADLFKSKGWLSWEKLYLYSGVLITLLLLFITFDNGRASAPLWGFVMFLSTMTMISFPLMRNLFSDGEVGRVLSLLNFTIFVASFLMQWFVGFVLSFYPVIGGHFAVEGYRLSLLVIAALNVAAVLHFCYSLRKRSKSQEA